MATKIEIADRSIGDGEPGFIIAEAGSNHNGNLEQALRRIDGAVDAGADAVKFQLFRASKLYPNTAGRSDYLKLDRSIYDIIADPAQARPLHDEALEARLAKQMRDLLAHHGAPQRQFGRMGL